MENSNWNIHHQRGGGSFSQSRVVDATKAFMQKVYLWMSMGLVLTAVLAYFVAGSDAMHTLLYSNSMTIWILLLAELGLVFAISGAINKMSSTTAKGLFLLYAALNGITLSSIFLVYELPSIASTFFVTAGTFGLMSVYGYVTKKDLSSWGSILMMGLIGIILASVVNIFIGSSMMGLIISAVGVLIFTGLVAYDTQKLKMIAGDAMRMGEEQVGKVAILGALSLYLDFINLFLMLLRFLGNRD
ncbi:Bax inhibitor-1/YccA family protein [Persicobacter diffluens]|uniref:Membrane protein n=1 Tax=Persicobacter diffluens TaxID=981 RepID=A0AAN4W359_9BACT|nr:membrane protein [Persicobacter diffluens]